MRLVALVGVGDSQGFGFAVRGDNNASLVRRVGNNARWIQRRRRGVGVVVGNDVCFATGQGAIAIFGNHCTAVFNGFRTQGHFARRRVNGDVFRQGVFRDPFAARVFGHGQGVRLTRFVGVFDFQRRRFGYRGDDDTALVRRVFHDLRRFYRRRRRRAAVGIGDDVSVRAGVGAIAVVCFDGAAVFHCLRGDGDFTRRRVNGHAARQGAFRDPFAARVFGEAHAMRLALFVGVVDVQRGRFAVRGDDDAAFVRRVFRHCRRVDAARLWLRIWTRIRVRAWARTGIGVRVRVRVGRRRGVVVVGDNGGFHAAVAAVAVLRGHAGAVFDAVRCQGDFAGVRINNDARRQAAIRLPFAVRAFVDVYGVRLSRFVGVFDF